MVTIVFQTNSIASGAEESVMSTTAEIKAAQSSTITRTITKVGLAGATVNTGVLNMYVGTDNLGRFPNGVTNTAGAPMKQEDSYSRNDVVGPNETLDLRLRNTSGGALQYYVYLDIEDTPTDEDLARL